MDRHTFLYDIDFWEALAFVRGIQKRNILTYQLQRLQAYFTCFSFRENKMNQTPSQWLPLYFDKLKEENAITEDEIAELQKEMNILNSRINEENNNEHDDMATANK